MIRIDDIEHSFDMYLAEPMTGMRLEFTGEDYELLKNALNSQVYFGGRGTGRYYTLDLNRRFSEIIRSSLANADKNTYCRGIKPTKIIVSNPPYTTIVWSDKTVTVVKCAVEDLNTYQPITGVKIAFCKKFCWKQFKKEADQYFGDLKTGYARLANLYCNERIPAYNADEVNELMWKDLRISNKKKERTKKDEN